MHIRPSSILLRLFIVTCILLSANTLHADHSPRFSTAGFYELPGTGRTVSSMNPAWRFFKGSAPGAEAVEFDDSGWSSVSLPHGLELLPTEASGCINYQGESWYRKHFTPADSLKGKELFIHFEAIMGKSKVWLNGELIAEHFGGYLPVIANITDKLKFGSENILAVMTDNSDDPSYPPGKPQDMLDFTYCGGIYRDCWLVSHNDVHITDPNFENLTADGGLFVHFGKVSEQKADVGVKLHVRNSSSLPFNGYAEWQLTDKAGRVVASAQSPLSLRPGRARSVSRGMEVAKPELWSPEHPYLYNLNVYVKDRNGNTVDGYSRRIGIRSFEFKGKDGFYLNGKPYGEPLIGANRHQDFAVIGNALPNSLHWRDARKLRQAGLKVIRNAHYPQDPAFMDACDELGLLVIVNTPGWQFWNNDPIFGQRVYSDIRNIVRRDRNHPSVWMWEPILNETWYPETFAKDVVEIVHQEYPYPYCYCASDAAAKGHEHFPILFEHPNAVGDNPDPKITYFTREWGDNVDDWNSHNSPSRVGRGWGEYPMLVQAKGYANPDNYNGHTSYDILYRQSPQHVGGCLWHSFDHQRGYHPLPFYGGIMDAFRQPKLSYHLFEAQRPAAINPDLIAGSGPMVYIAHAMTPFSPRDVTVYSNCDEVRLINCAGGDTLTYTNPRTDGMPAPPIVFENVWDVMHDKALDRSGHRDDSYLLAEGLVEGKVVATHKVMPARRPARLLLWADSDSLSLKADGSDIVTVIAAVADEAGRIRRLENYDILFDIEGPGHLLADKATFTNPRRTEWGTAPVLVQAATTPGTIKVKASVAIRGIYTPVSAEIEIPVTAADHPMIANPIELQRTAATTREAEPLSAPGQTRKTDSNARLKEVEQQQKDFE
ncbi:MAG: glycoside hydrolase family 2 protein [Muribaculaceae bacterium]|nr:glycoside hydrolase family 2 protein [Muribaculaceae bacterium]